MKHLLAAFLILILGAGALPTLAHAPDAVVVEYYHPTLDHYFVSASKVEQALLEQGAFDTWQRTGAAFRAYMTGESGTQPVCRFYLRMRFMRTIGIRTRSARRRCRLTFRVIRS